MGMTNKQRRRQQYRSNGKYAKVNPCYCCGKSAGENYCSHRETDQAFNDEGLCLCDYCCGILDAMPNDQALLILKKANYGQNPQDL